MSVSRSDLLDLTLFGMNGYMLSGVVLIVGSIILLIYGIFGTISISKIISEYKRKNRLAEKYNKKFEIRDTLLYHISWARSRGDHDEANSMIKQLIQLDKDIDRIEQECIEVFGKKTSVRSSVKLKK